MRKYLKRFKNFTKNWEKKEGRAGGNFSSRKLEGMGFHSSNPRRFAERMVRNHPRDDGHLAHKAVGENRLKVDQPVKHWDFALVNQKTGVWH